MTAAPPRTRRLHGWGGTAPTAATVLGPCNAEAVHAALLGAASHPDARGVTPRGAGRAYGDAATNAGGTVLDLTGLDRIGEVAVDDGCVTVGGGASLRAVLDAVAPQGWTLPVVPGTAHVTVGGAIASDVHGKDHPVVGSFGRHVRRVQLVTSGGVSALTPADDPDAFWATVGGMGLTGVIVEATLQLEPIHTHAVVAGRVRTQDLADTMERLEAAGRAHRGAVAWLDLLTRERIGRGVVDWIDPAGPADIDDPGMAARGQSRSRGAPTVPPTPVNLVRPAAVRAANRLRWQRAPRTPRQQVLDLDAARFPLDTLDHWSRLYGPRGFVQHQCLVPPDRADLIERLVGTIRAEHVPVTLAVLKRLGTGSAGHLSFPAPGWTLAVDMPADVDGLGILLDRFDRWVADAGGRVYLTKDARMSPDLLPAMYPRLDEWRAVRDRLDPDRLLTSDLGRRLGVVRDA